MNIFKSDLVKSAHFVGKYDFPMLKMTEILPFDSVNKNDTKNGFTFTLMIVSLKEFGHTLTNTKNYSRNFPAS